MLQILRTVTAVPYAATSLVMLAIALQSKRIAKRVLAPLSRAPPLEPLYRMIAAVGGHLGGKSGRGPPLILEFLQFTGRAILLEWWRST